MTKSSLLRPVTFPIWETQLEALTAVREISIRMHCLYYGLENPAYTITVKESPEIPRTFYIGNASGENYYATVDE
jgi:hypothetical protein